MFIHTTPLTPIKLKAAIIVDPLVVSPDTTVMDAIAKMSGMRSHCHTTKTADTQLDDLHLGARSSCVLVVENGQLLGIMTERDVVRLSAGKQPLDRLAIRQVMAHPIVTLPESAFTDLFFAINLLQQHHIRHLPIVDEQNHLVGVVTHETLRQTCRSVDLLRLRLVSEVMTTDVICAAPDDSMLAIAQLMAKHRISSVMIVEPGRISNEPLQIPVGILTERDLVQFQALGLNLETCLAQAVMSTPIFAVKPRDSLWVVQQIMEQRLIHRLAVTGEQGELLGIVTQTSLLQSLNPLELYKMAELLQEQVETLKQEKVKLLENRNIELERQVEERTVALKAKADREKLLNTIADQLRSSLNVSDTLDATVQQILSLLGCDRVIIYQFRPDFSGTVIAEAITGTGRSVIHTEVHDPCLSPEWLEPYRQGRIRIVNDIYGEAMTQCHQELLVGFDIRAKLMVPLVISEQLWGLTIASYRSTPHLWTTNEIELVRQVSLQVAIALEQATTHQKLQEELIERQQAEARLQASEKQLQELNQQLEIKVAERTQKLSQVNSLQRAILDSADYSIISTNTTGIIQTFNAGAERMLGYSATEMIGIATPELIHDRQEVIDRAASLSAELGLDIPSGFEVFVAKAQQGIVNEEEWSYIRKDGSHFPVLLSVTAIEDVNQQIIGFLGIAKDITQRQRAEAELKKVSERLALSLKSGDIGCWDWNIRENIILWDERMYELYGVNKQSDSRVVYDLWATGLHPDDRIPTETLLQQAVLGQAEYDTEFRVVHPDGSIHFIKASGVLVRDAQGNAQSLIGINFDISDRKYSELENQQLKERLEFMLSASPAVIFSCKAEGDYGATFVSDNIFNLTGYTPTEFLATSSFWADHLHPEDAPLVFAKLTKIFQQGHHIQEYRFQHQQGHYIWIQNELRLVRNQQGTPREIVGYVIDISKRKQGEIERQQLIQELSAFKLALDESAIVTITDAHGVITYVNDRFCEISGYSRNELIGKTHRIINSGYHAIAFFQELWHTITRGKIWRGEICNRTKKGALYWVESTIVPFLDPQGQPFEYLSIRFDITARKFAEATIQQENNFRQQILENMAEGLCVCYEIETFPFVRFTVWNHQMQVITGYTLEEINTLGAYQSLFPVSELPAQAIARMRQMRQGENMMIEECEIQQKDGEKRTVAISTSVLSIDNGNNYVLALLKDITESKQIEAKLAESEAKFRRLVEGANDVIWSCNVDGILTYLSPQFKTLFGWDESEWIGKPFIELVHPEDCSLIANDYRNNILSGKKSNNSEFRHRHRNGYYIWVRTSATPVINAQGTVISIQGILSDISNFKQTEIALKASENKFRKVFTSNVVGMMFTDFNGQILDANDRLLEIIGYTRADLNANRINLAEITPPEHAANDRKAMEYLESYQAIDPWEKEYYRQDGSRVPVLIGVALLTETESSCVCVVVDITAPKQAEQKLQQQAKQEHLLGSITQRMRSSLNLEEILNSTVGELHQVLQSDRVLVYRVFPGGTGAAIAESVLSNLPKLLDITFPEEVFPQENYDRYLEGRIYVLNDREAENQEILPCLVEFLAKIQVRAKLVVPIIQDESLWGLLIAHQCDRPRQWEEWEINLMQQTADQLAIAIQQSTLFKQLNQELAERQQAEAKLTNSNQKLAISNEELARATRLKDEFLANMSHELRTPLNAILGMTEGLQEEVFGTVNEQQIKALQTIARSGSHLLELINDILDVAKIESGQLELDFSPVSMAHLCQSSLAFIKQQALKKRLQLEIKLPPNLPDLLVDERRIRQVLINLLNNAVKFTPAGGRITLEVNRKQSPAYPNSADFPPQNYLRIAVIDTGIGIAPADIHKLFQPFIQIDSALNRQYTGTGLGLALVKRIVEQHGGEVGLTSEVGVGSCFTIDLPFPAGVLFSPDLASQPEQGIEPSQPELSSSPLILLAEDNEANIITISSYLQAKGYRIVLARNGQEAIDLALSEHPDLILMDIQMPGMDGIEAIQQLRRYPNLVNVLIIALTALAMDSDRDRCLAAGANDYISKPMKLKQLVTTIQQLLTTKDDTK